MFRNYLLTSVRNLRRNATTSLINVLGLGLGMGCCILAVAFIRYELSVDRHHEKIDRIVRVVYAKPGEGEVVPRASGALGPALKEAFPEVVDFTRMDARFVWTDRGVGSMTRYRMDVVDPSLFNILTIPFVSGDPLTAFDSPDALVVSETAARQWFGSTDPVGQTVSLESGDSGGTYRITGVMKDNPSTSSRPFDLFSNTVVSSAAVQAPGVRSHAMRRWEDWREGRDGPTLFLLLRSKQDAETLAKRLPAFLEGHLGKEWVATHEYRLQPLADVHLNNRKYGIRVAEMGPLGSDIGTLYTVGGTALLILFVASANFVNLSLVGAGARRREIGIRKATGAHRQDIASQFLFESSLTTLAAICVGLAVTVAGLPVFRSHSGHDLPGVLTVLSGVLPYVPILWLVITLGSGLYPAIVLSAYHPVRVLRSTGQGASGSGFIRKTLILFQFAACILLISGTLVTQRQTDYMHTKHLGFDRDLIVSMGIFGTDMGQKSDQSTYLNLRYSTVKSAVLAHPDILVASAFRFPPGMHGGYVKDIRADGKMIRMRVIDVDEDYLGLFNIPLVAGRNFNPAAMDAPVEEFILTESAAAALGWTDPIGKSFDWRDWGPPRDGQVVGVIRDFHTEGLTKRIEPFALYFKSHRYTTLGAKVNPDRIPEAIEHMKTVWTHFLPNWEFRYSFLDDRIEALYRREAQTAQIMRDFSMLGILLGCMGLFGLVSFTVQQRRKEIGIRKALGATVTSIVGRLARESTWVVILANGIAWPIGIYLLQGWLERYAYRIDLHAGYFAFSGGIAFCVALLTVVSQATRAARTNPADVLREE